MLLTFFRVLIFNIVKLVVLAIRHVSCARYNASSDFKISLCIQMLVSRITEILSFNVCSLNF